jgi:hypothetical protein
MRAHLKRLTSPDVADLRTFRPRDPANFAIVVDANIGVETLQEGENFRMLLCTPVWLMENHGLGDVVIGHQLLIVFRYDFEAVVRRLVDFCQRCEGDDWYAIARQLHIIGRWEFETEPQPQTAP